MHAYASAVLGTVTRVCALSSCPDPTLLSESGTALTAPAGALVIQAVIPPEGRPSCSAHGAARGAKWPRSAAQEAASTPAEALQINASVFQSLPDVWATSQHFPVVSLSPGYTLADGCELRDITCDSDGVPITGGGGFVQHGLQTAPAVPACPSCQHSGLGAPDFSAAAMLGPEEGLKHGGACCCDAGLSADEDVLKNRYGDVSLAVLQIGAYQQALASRHNLFGRPDTLYISICAYDPAHFVPRRAAAPSGQRLIALCASTSSDASSLAPDEELLSLFGLPIPRGHLEKLGLKVELLQCGNVDVCRLSWRAETLGDMLSVLGYALPAQLRQFSAESTYLRY